MKIKQITVYNWKLTDVPIMGFQNSGHLYCSEQHNSIKKLRLQAWSFLLLDVMTVLQVPFGIPHYIQCMHHGLTFILLCVLFIFADNTSLQFTVARNVLAITFMTWIICIFYSNWINYRGTSLLFFNAV